MLNKTTLIIIIVVIIIICIVIYYLCSTKIDLKQSINLSQKFFHIDDISQSLKNINYNKIKSDIIKIYDIDNSSWKELNSLNQKSLKIFPFYGFNKWIKQNCDKCPYIYNFLNNIPNLKGAFLFNLEPKTKLPIHNGSSEYSRDTIRCYYGIKIPDGSYISIVDNDNETKKYLLQRFWTCFDNSKNNYEENPSDTNNLVFVVDIERPKNIKKGTCDISKKDELEELINKY